MGAESKIEWCRHTFNPWRGCTKISPGCANCYAEKLSLRNPTTLGVWGDDGVRAMASESYWREPLKWDAAAKEAGERHRVFCASLADVFEDRPELENPRRRLLMLAMATPNLDWLLLTKRPQNVADLTPIAWADGWPANIWIGTSVEDQARAEQRIPILVRIPARVRFLSMEPLLGPVDIARWLFKGFCPVHDFPGGFCIPPCPHDLKVDWVIVGGESGSQARPMHPAWAQSLRDQCQKFGTPFHFKQWGEWAPSGEWYDTAHCKLMNRRDARLVPVTMGWGKWHDFVDYASVRRFGKSTAGRLLDGRTWDEFPEVRP